MKAAMIGDNCIDEYVQIDGVTVNRKYPTGNCVDTGVNLQKLGILTSIISTTGNDENGKWMLECLKKEGLDITHLKIGDGETAITYMDIVNHERIHGEYMEGVLAHIEFDDEDIAFAASHDLVHSALWGNAQDALPKIKKAGCLVSFDYADRLEHPLVESTLPYVDYGFYSYHGKRDSKIEAFLQDKVNRGMKMAIATFGENGSLAYSKENGFTECGIVHTDAVCNTVGAGDSYIAGFLSGILNGKPVARCMEIGAKTAAEVIQVFEPWVQ